MWAAGGWRPSQHEAPHCPFPASVVHGAYETLPRAADLAQLSRPAHKQAAPNRSLLSSQNQMMGLVLPVLVSPSKRPKLSSTTWVSNQQLLGVIGSLLQAEGQTSGKGKIDYIWVRPTPDLPIDLFLDDASRQAVYESHRECVQTGQWPSDHGIEAFSVRIPSQRRSSQT
eukprot:304176-Amphidinium_carterae.1